MQRIKVLRNLGRGLPDFTEHQVVEVDDEVAADLCNRGLAEIVTPTLKAVPQEPLKGIPPEEPAEGSVEKSEVDLKDYSHKARRAKADGN